MTELISKWEFISETLKDDLNSGSKDYLNKHKEIIENPDLFSVRENYIRSQLVSMNGAFGNLLNQNNNLVFIKKNINEEEFLKLNWCPKGNNTQDAIDLMSDNKRILNLLLNYLKNRPEEEKQIVKDEIQKYFNGNTPTGNKKKLFLLEKCHEIFIMDGNHRTGAILKYLSEDKDKNLIFPLEVYIVKVEDK